MSNIIASFDYVDRTSNLSLGGDEALETRYKTKGELFKNCLKEYGRCVSRCYVGDHRQIGWVFEKKKKYEDVNEYFLLETWVVVHDAIPEVEHKVTYHYATF